MAIVEAPLGDGPRVATEFLDDRYIVRFSDYKMVGAHRVPRACPGSPTKTPPTSTRTCTRTTIRRGPRPRGCPRALGVYRAPQQGGEAPYRFRRRPSSRETNADAARAVTERFRPPARRSPKHERTDAITARIAAAPTACATFAAAKVCRGAARCAVATRKQMRPPRLRGVSQPGSARRRARMVASAMARGTNAIVASADRGRTWELGERPSARRRGRARRRFALHASETFSSKSSWISFRVAPRGGGAAPRSPSNATHDRHGTRGLVSRVESGRIGGARRRGGCRRRRREASTARNARAAVGRRGAVETRTLRLLRRFEPACSTRAFARIIRTFER